jgi:hypothetical protein
MCKISCVKSFGPLLPHQKAPPLPTVYLILLLTNNVIRSRTFSVYDFRRFSRFLIMGTRKYCSRKNNDKSGLCAENKNKKCVNQRGGVPQKSHESLFLRQDYLKGEEQTPHFHFAPRSPPPHSRKHRLRHTPLSWPYFAHFKHFAGNFVSSKQKNVKRRSEYKFKSLSKHHQLFGKKVLNSAAISISMFSKLSY